MNISNSFKQHKHLSVHLDSVLEPSINDSNVQTQSSPLLVQLQSCAMSPETQSITDIVADRSQAQQSDFPLSGQPPIRPLNFFCDWSLARSSFKS